MMSCMEDDLKLMVRYLRFTLRMRKVAGFVALCICSVSLVLISQRFSGNDYVLRATLTLMLHALVQVLISSQFRKQCDVTYEWFYNKNHSKLRNGGNHGEL